jgi:hypothetical protein
MERLSDSAARALCGIAEKAMIEKGISPDLAEAFTKRACRPLVSGAARAVGRTAKKVGGKVKRGASAYNKKFAAMYRKLKKKHPRMSFGALAKKAHRALRGKKR